MPTTMRAWRTFSLGENPRAADKTSAEELLTLEQERSSRPPAGDSDSDSDDDYEPDSDCDSD